MLHHPVRKRKQVTLRMWMALDLLAQPRMYLHQRGNIRWEVRKDGTMVHYMTATALVEHGLVERRGPPDKMNYRITQKGRDALVDRWFWPGRPPCDA